MKGVISEIVMIVSLSVSAFGVINSDESMSTQDWLSDCELIIRHELDRSDDLTSEEAFQKFAKKSFKMQSNLLFPGEFISTSIPELSGLNALHRAVLSGDLALCKRIYKQKPELISLKDSASFSAFDYALAKGETEIAKFLVQQDQSLIGNTVVLAFCQPYREYVGTKAARLVPPQYSIVLAVVYNRLVTVKWFFEFIANESFRGVSRRSSRVAQGDSAVFQILKNSESNNFNYNLLSIAMAYDRGSVADCLLDVIKSSSIKVQEFFLTHLGKLTQVMLNRSAYDQVLDGFSFDIFPALLRIDEKENFDLSKCLKNEKSVIEVLFYSESEPAIDLLNSMKYVMSKSSKKDGAREMIKRHCKKESLRDLFNKVKNRDFKKFCARWIKEMHDSLDLADLAAADFCLESEVEGCQSSQQLCPVSEPLLEVQSPVTPSSSRQFEEFSSARVCDDSRSVLVLAQEGSIEDVWKFLGELKRKAVFGGKEDEIVFNQAIDAFEDGSRNNILHLLLKRSVLTPDFLDQWVQLLSEEQIVSLFFHENLEGEAPISKLMELKGYQDITRKIASRKRQIQKVLLDQETEGLGAIAKRFKSSREAILKDIKQDEVEIARFRHKLQRLASRAG
jgi:hypothetical protein